MKAFLKALWKIFVGFSDNDPSDSVDDQENITRYIFQRKGRFNAETGTVKYAAFSPAKDGHASVYRTSGLKDLTIWELGIEHVEKKRTDGRKLLARADLLAKHIRRSRLDVVLLWSSPTGHPAKHIARILWACCRPASYAGGVSCNTRCTLSHPPQRLPLSGRHSPSAIRA